VVDGKPVDLALPLQVARWGFPEDCVPHATQNACFVVTTLFTFRKFENISRQTINCINVAMSAARVSD
jgi:hypothetical protein